jgi:hypothetical protein
MRPAACPPFHPRIENKMVGTAQNAPLPTLRKLKQKWRREIIATPLP